MLETPAIAAGARERAGACRYGLGGARRSISLRAASIRRSKSSRAAHGPALPIACRESTDRNRAPIGGGVKRPGT